MSHTANPSCTCGFPRKPGDIHTIFCALYQPGQGGAGPTPSEKNYGFKSDFCEVCEVAITFVEGIGWTHDLALVDPPHAAVRADHAGG